MQNYQNLRNFKTSGFGNNQWPKLVAIPAENLRAVAENQLNLCY